MIVKALWWVGDRVASWLVSFITCDWDDMYMDYDYPMSGDRQ